MIGYRTRINLRQYEHVLGILCQITFYQMKLVDGQTLYMKERKKCFIYRHIQHILFTVIWRQTYGKGPVR